MSRADRFIHLYRTIRFLLCVGGFSFIVWGTFKWGIGLSPDSYSYIICAKNLAAGLGYYVSSGTPFTGWPPLFPTLIAGLELAGLDPVVWLIYCNATVFALTIFFAEKLFSLNLKSRPLVFLGTLLTATSVPIMLPTLMAWSEPVFILLTVLFLLALELFIREQKKRYFLAAALFAALASLQRYIGITFYLTGATSILLLSSEKSVFEKLKKSLFFSLCALTPVLLWLLRNYLLTSHLAGSRGPTQYTLFDNLRSAVQVLLIWLFPKLSLSMSLLVIGLIIGLYVPIRSYYTRRMKSEKMSASFTESNIKLTVVLFTGIYVSAIIIMTSLTSLDKELFRYLSPAYIPVLCVFLFAVEKIFDTLHLIVRNKKIATSLLVLFILFYSIPAIVTAVTIIKQRYEYGPGVYSTASVRNSDIVLWLKRNKIEGRLFSNGPDAIYLLNNTMAEMSPSRSEDPEKFKGLLKEDPRPCYLVWFGFIIWRDYLSTPKEIAAYVNVVPQYVFESGAIYLLGETNEGPSGKRESSGFAPKRFG